MENKKVINFEKLEKHNIEFQLDDRVILTDLKVYQEDDKVTFSFYLEEKDYYDGDGVIEQEMSDYIFNLLDKHNIDNLESFYPEFIDCDNQNNIFSYDFRFHVKTTDSLNRDRVDGKLYSKNPKTYLIRLTKEEKIIVIINRSLEKFQDYDYKCLLETLEKELITKYRSFIETIDNKISYERSLENFFSDFLNLKEFDYHDIKEYFEELTKFAREYYFITD